jgi:hypothetical protein
MKDDELHVVAYDLREACTSCPKVMDAEFVELSGERMEFALKGSAS